MKSLDEFFHTIAWANQWSIFDIPLGYIVAAIGLLITLAILIDSIFGLFPRKAKVEREAKALDEIATPFDNGLSENKGLAETPALVLDPKKHETKHQ